MTSALLVFLSTLGLARAVGICDWRLISIPERVVRNTIALTELTPKRLLAARERMHAELAGLKAWGDVPLVERERLVRRDSTELDAALADIATGHEGRARQRFQRLVERWNHGLDSSFKAWTFFENAQSTARTFADELALGPLVLRGGPSPETALFETVLELRRRSEPETDADPRAIEMLKIALRYGTFSDSDRVLEIGQRHGANRRALSRLTGGAVARVDANDLFPRLDPGIGEALGSYQTILAYEVFTNAAELGRIEAIDVARGLRARLAPGGTLILVNHRDTKPFFTKEEAVEAGLKVVRWNERRFVGPEWSKFLPPGPRRKFDARVHAFVLRHPGS